MKWLRRLFCFNSNDFSDVEQIDGRWYSQCRKCGTRFEIPPEPRP